MKTPARLIAHLASLALLSPMLSAQESAVKAPPIAETAPAQKQGLTLTFSAGGKSDTRAARLVALAVPAGQAATPFLPAGPFTAKWEADIISDLRAEFTFAAEVQGAVKVTLNGATILEGSAKVEGKALKLQKGANKIAVEFTSPAKGDALLRLLWSSKEFPWEPVPPSAFQHNASATDLRAGERVRAGRQLFAELRCAACHDGAGLVPARGAGMPELAQDAPTFDDVGAKFREPWLAAWISDPHAIRPRTLMPRVFAEGKPGQIDQRAADLAAYFVSISAPPEAKPLDASLAPQGAALFANLGCIACHSKPDGEAVEQHARVSLAHVRRKWHAPALAAYLKEPAKNFAWSRMPHFRLSDGEAAQLTTYLLTSAQEEGPAAPKGDATRGAQLLVSSGCLNCHAGLPPTTTPTLALTLKGGWTKGCLAADAPARGKAPDFAFTPAQRDALSAFAAAGFASLKQDVAIEFAERQVANLRCIACHARDDQASLWSKLDDETAPLAALAPIEEGEGKPVATTALPPLTWLGEKLQPAWMAQFIAGHGKDKPRPWLVARMPGFPAVAEGLAHGLSHAHGFPLAAAPALSLTAAPEKVKAGETLIGENGGFNCLQCHAIGDRAATAVFEAPAPNFAYTRERLRKEYFDRWLLFPLRIDPETKMPRFADDDGKTPLTDFFGGKASEQYDAIWQYLQTLKK